MNHKSKRDPTPHNPEAPMPQPNAPAGAFAKPAFPLSPRFGAPARAARGAAFLDAHRPGWVEEMFRAFGPIENRYDYENGWGFIACDVRGLFRHVLPVSDDPSVAQSRWMLGLRLTSPLWSTPYCEDRKLDAAWAYEVWRRQRKTQTRGFLPKVIIDNRLSASLSLGLVTLPKGQWIQLAHSDKPARWLGVSPSGCLQILHWPRCRSTAEVSEACKRWSFATQEQRAAMLPFPPECTGGVR